MRTEARQPPIRGPPGIPIRDFPSVRMPPEIAPAGESVELTDRLVHPSRKAQSDKDLPMLGQLANGGQSGRKYPGASTTSALRMFSRVGPVKLAPLGQRTDCLARWVHRRRAARGRNDSGPTAAHAA
jgi:hypothetical protein